VFGICLSLNADLDLGIYFNADPDSEFGSGHFLLKNEAQVQNFERKSSVFLTVCFLMIKI